MWGTEFNFSPPLSSLSSDASERDRQLRKPQRTLLDAPKDVSVAMPLCRLRHCDFKARHLLFPTPLTSGQPGSLHLNEKLDKGPRRL